MKILIVEDDEKILSFLKKGFKEHGFCADAAASGREGYFMASEGEYDCMVLDIMLPDLDGYDILSKLKAKGKNTPVIFLTAKDSVNDKVKGLDLGADDYLVKPFAFSELLARVNAIIRRGKEQKTTEYRVADLVLDIPKRRVTRAGKKISLTPTEFSLLQYLLEKKGEVVTRTMLSEGVWGYDFDSTTNVIDVHMTNLRKKIDTDRAEELIKTVRGVGYRLEAEEDVQ